MAASVSGEQALWVATVATRGLSHDPLLTFCCGHISCLVLCGETLDVHSTHFSRI